MSFREDVMLAFRECNRLFEIEEKYNELIMAVVSKYPEETRHQTALRYILDAEQRIQVGQTHNNSLNPTVKAALDPERDEAAG